MPFLIYLPWIVWSGLFSLAHDARPASVKVKAKR
jgi:hypothetical protein